MSSSVINGAIGKSPLIDKINQLAAREATIRANAQMEQYIYGRETLKYPPVQVSFPNCRKEMKNQLSMLRKEHQDKNDVF